MSKQSIRPQGAEGISHPRTIQKPPATVKRNGLTPDALPIDRHMVEFHLDCMLDQKERTRALLSVILGMVAPIDNPDLTTIVSLAVEINEEHGSWYDLRECLGIGEEKESGGAA